MTSKNQNEHTQIAVLGAGISGLTVAYFAKQAGQSVRLFESGHRVGGSIRSEKKDGFLLEYGPNTVLPTAELMELIQDLDLTSNQLIGDAKLPRFIQYQGQLHAAPISLSSFLKTKLLSRTGRARILAEPFIPRRTEDGEESLMSFATRRFGTEGAERLLAPFVSGVWAGDPSQLSAEGAFPKLVDWEKKKGSLFMGIFSQKRKKEKGRTLPRGLLSFSNGLETLPLALAKNLQGIMAPYTQIRKISRESNHWILTGKDFECTADRIVITCPADQAAALLEPTDLPTSLALREIPYAPLAVVHLAIKTTEVKSDLHAFGHLIAPSEKLETLGCLYSSSIFSNRAPKDITLLTVFVGGARFPEILQLNDQELLKKAVTALQPVMGLQKHPDLIALTRYERAIPQYTLGHAKRMSILKDFEKKCPGIQFAGNYVGGISVGDVIKRSKTLVATISG